MEYKNILSIDSIFLNSSALSHCMVLRNAYQAIYQKSDSSEDIDYIKIVALHLDEISIW